MKRQELCDGGVQGTDGAPYGEGKDGRECGRGCWPGGARATSRLAHPAGNSDDQGAT